MDFHGRQTNPIGYRAAFRKDADGRGYTLEYAIPWALLKAESDPPRAGDTLAATWTVHWSDESSQAAAGGGNWSRSAIPPNRCAYTTGIARQAGARRCSVEASDCSAFDKVVRGQPRTHAKGRE